LWYGRRVEELDMNIQQIDRQKFLDSPARDRGEVSASLCFPAAARDRGACARSRCHRPARGEARGMRNLFVHIYWVIDDTIVYNVARKEASILADQIDRLLESLA
jgi:hypothetical protein